MPLDRRPSLLELCVAKVGVLKGARVVVLLAVWSYAMGQAGASWADLNMTERVERYAEAAQKSRAQAFRDLALYRRVFDRAPDPTTVVELYGLDVKTLREAKRFSGLVVPA